MANTNTNTNLSAAKKAKKDEFYTQLSDIENEMKYYRRHFMGKVVFCNCDDPFESNFFKYFVLNFNRLGLKKLIATCYTGSPIAGTQLTFEDIGKEFVGADRAYKAIVTEVYDATGNGGVDMLDVAELFKQGKNTIEELEGDGDFRSPECLTLLDLADIVVTNPPFSLFKEYVATLIEHEKKFIIIGNKNAIKYKEIFPLFAENKIWIGATPISRELYFDVPQSYIDDGLSKGKDRSIVMHNGRWMHRSQSIWYTNLDIKKRHESLILIKRYDPMVYPTYENYDAIDVGRTADIPYDYAGYMGVPFTFMSIYNPDQFEIKGLAHGNLGVEMGIVPYDRKLKPLNKGLRDGDLFYMDHDVPIVPYTRVVIRNLKPEQPKA